NLEDLTFRALRTLKEVNLIAAEDTRRTGKLLAHYGIAKPVVSLHEHNEHREAPKLVARLLRGESIALVSDAGTPALSDPGAMLVRLAREAGSPVVPIPGPSAVTAALSVSGLPATPFTFAGFPPPSGTARERWLESVFQTSGTIVFFEAPHRVERTLADLEPLLVNRKIILNRELSKIHEQSVKWPIDSSQLKTSILARGEFVVVVGPSGRPESEPGTVEKLLPLFDLLMESQLVTEDEALRALGALTDNSPRSV